MAKWANDDVMDAALDKVATGITQTACNAQPTTYAQATNDPGSSGYALADITLTAGDGNGDYTIAAGDTNGRKVTIAAQTGVTIDYTGTATHVAICDGTSLLYVTTCDSQALTATNTVTFPTWDIEIGDPT